MSPRISSIAIVIDCADPERLARFWCDLFGWKLLWRKGPYVGLSMDEPTSHVTWILQRVIEPKSGKSRSHPDFSVDDLMAVMNRVIELGGSRVSGYGKGGFLVMADPEGNEFCLVPSGEFAMDDNGSVDYLSGPLAHLRED
jgi:predicted enzyme related to lactoylglutathione lyase